LRKPTPTPPDAAGSLAEALGWLDRQAGLLGGGRPLPLAELETFLNELSAYNEHTNLVASSEPGRLVSEHVLDSLSLCPLLGHAGSLVDIGSGAGFPGLVLAIVMPELTVTLVESVGKKAGFLASVSERLGLAPRVEVVCERAESIGRQARYRERYEAATARAVGALGVVVELSFPLLQVGGSLYAQRSRKQAENERPQIDELSRLMGGYSAQTIDLGSEVIGRELAVIKLTKTAPTPERYPRPMAQIKRNPLASA